MDIEMCKGILDSIHYISITTSYISEEPSYRSDIPESAIHDI